MVQPNWKLEKKILLLRLSLSQDGSAASGWKLQC